MIVRRAAVAAGALGYAWWVVSLAPFSGAATVAVVASGLAAAAFGWYRLRPQPAPAPPRTLVPWIVVIALVAGWQLAAYVQGPREEHPTLSSLTNAVLDFHPARAAAFALWLLTAALIARR